MQPGSAPRLARAFSLRRHRSSRKTGGEKGDAAVFGHFQVFWQRFAVLPERLRTASNTSLPHRSLLVFSPLGSPGGGKRRKRSTARAVFNGIRPAHATGYCTTSCARLLTSPPPELWEDRRRERRRGRFRPLSGFLAAIRCTTGASANGQQHVVTTSIPTGLLPPWVRTQVRRRGKEAQAV